MDRTFERSTQRRRRTLDGQWEFLTDPEDEGRDLGYGQSFPSEEADTVPVPCSWNALDEYADYVGPAWYRRTFSLPEATAVSLTFHGVGHDATVYLDGEEIFSHGGGYTPFSTYVRDLDAGSHELVVRADNSRSEAALLHGGTDWFPHGGIYREVVLAEISGIWVSDLDVGYDLDGDDATVEADVTLHNVSPTPSEGHLVVSVGGTTATEKVEVGGLNAARERFELDVEGVDRWSPDDPTLYDLVVAVSNDGAGGDDLRERIGFREVDVEGTQVLLNGDPIELVGVNREEFHPDWGHAEPLRVQQNDVETIAEAGFNTVRSSRYPLHPRFLDLCDETGLLVVEGVTPHEADTDWDVEEPPDPFAEASEAHEPLEDLDDPTGEARRIVTEMVQRDAGHPSVVAWSLGNSAASPDGGIQEALHQLQGSITGLDDSRLLTASCRLDHVGESEEVLERSDLVCVNVDRRAHRNWDRTLDDLLAAVEDKPVVVSEFGVEGVPGERSLAERRESESHQAAYLGDAVDAFLAREGIAGFAVRQFTDTLAGTGPSAQVRATDYSGILTGYRQPKAAYDALRQRLDDR